MIGALRISKVEINEILELMIAIKSLKVESEPIGLFLIFNDQRLYSVLLVILGSNIMDTYKFCLSFSFFASSQKHLKQMERLGIIFLLREQQQIFGSEYLDYKLSFISCYRLNCDLIRAILAENTVLMMKTHISSKLFLWNSWCSTGYLIQSLSAWKCRLVKNQRSSTDDPYTSWFQGLICGFYLLKVFQSHHGILTFWTQLCLLTIWELLLLNFQMAHLNCG
jgi:hypothetical protein